MHDQESISAEELKAAEELGRKAAKNQAGWLGQELAQGRILEPGELLERVREDSAALYEVILPPTLSGEWADEMTPLMLARELGLEDPESGAIRGLEAACEAWEDGVGETFEAECERLLELHAGGVAGIVGTFRLELELGNAAMRTRRDVVRALHDAAELLQAGEDSAPVRDANGNTVGRLELELELPPRD